jgi:hypothetical protein
MMKKLLPALLLLVATAAWGCETNDLGRFCVVGQPIPPINTNGYGQPSVTVLNIEAPECNKRICLQQGPVKLHETHIVDPTAQCSESWCLPPYKCEPDIDNKCAFRIRSVCTKECGKHKDCKPGGEDANGEECTRYVCHKQSAGEAFEGHCICQCRDFLINPNADPPRFYTPDEVPNEPDGCK